MQAEVAGNYIDEKAATITAVSNRIWALAEVGLHEEQSAQYLADALRTEGFDVRLGAGGMPSGLEATWGEGRPVIGFLGEYDALPGVSQKALPLREELSPGSAGHGCGHNLLGAGAFGAVIGLKREMEARGLTGTIKYFGCPAEENFGGKAHMAREGLFTACDACLTWHPGPLNFVRSAASLAVDSMNVTFRGRTAHAAADPHNGRSALDAVQLMNLGVEFLREHMPAKARVHYVITNGGGQPNVVPATATVWYYVRAPQRGMVDELYQRVIRCARGAAEMTETECDIELLDAIWELLPNTTLEKVLAECMARVGPPRFGEAEREFARKLSESFRPGQREAFLAAAFEGAAAVPEELGGQLLNDTVVPRVEAAAQPRGSTDVGDTSWCCPTAQFGMACSAIGTPGHSWQFAAQSGMGIGHAGMLQAAKVLAEAGLVLLTDPATLAAAREEFARRTGGKAYRCAMPDGFKPPFHQLANK
ncbi:MAG: amidohydrolase [Bacillota bacterium]|nr:amidohydrolase [Bacillota bacterium]